MKRSEKALLVALLFVIVLSFGAFASDCGKIRKEVLRLHVIAHSDSKEDQELKIKVRDRILADSAELFLCAGNRGEAVALAEQNKDMLQKIAADEIGKQGFSYPVSVETAEMYFPTKQYEQVTMPAGDYMALRVTIGEAKGQNWWCVMFPPLCLPAATEQSEKTQLNDVLTTEQMNIVTQPESPQYEVRFKTLELLEEGKNFLKSLFDN